MIDLLAHIKGIFDKYKKDEVTVYAAQASFFIVTAFFPFIMLLLTLIQFLPNVGKSDLLAVDRDPASPWRSEIRSLIPFSQYYAGYVRSSCGQHH